MMPYACGDYILAHARLHTNPSDWMKKALLSQCFFLAPPAGLEGYFVMLTSENIVVYASSTLCLRSDGYTPYFRYLPSKNNTQLFFSVVYRLRLAQRYEQMTVSYAFVDRRSTKGAKTKNHPIGWFLFWLPLLGSNQRHHD